MTTSINVAAATDRITNANKRIEQQNSSITQIASIISSIDSVWDAEDQRVYSERFRDRQQKIEVFNSSLTDYLNNMQRYIDDCVAADREIANSINSIQW